MVGCGVEIDVLGQVYKCLEFFIIYSIIYIKGTRALHLMLVVFGCVVLWDEYLMNFCHSYLCVYNDV